MANEFKSPLDVLPINKERYISFTKQFESCRIKVRFIDSFRFMASSLDKLSSYLTEYNIVKSEFPNLEPEKLSLIIKKNYFPYEYVTSSDKLDETCLPSIEKFYSSLTGTSITDEQYKHAKTVWDKFQIKTLGEYSDLYMKVDILLLAEVFENFREQCYKAYGLDIANYFTAPGLSWDAMLKYTGIDLELITDIDQYNFIESGVRGGISVCTRRHAQANNKHMPNYDDTKESTFIIYLDATNLYGSALSASLPTGKFQWVPITTDYNVPDHADFGYILEVDLKYPKNIHDLHNDLPFCCENIEPPDSKQKKLLNTLDDKKNYIIHYVNLKQAVAYGLEVEKIHRILKFKQSQWLKPYIDFNTQMRTDATNDFEKNFFKLMNNSVYGME